MSDLFEGYVTVRRLPPPPMVLLRTDIGAAKVKTAIRNILLRKKTQEKIIALRLQSKVELRDPDLKKFAEEARKLRQKAMQEKRQQGGQPDANVAVRVALDHAHHFRVWDTIYA